MAKNYPMTVQRTELKHKGGTKAYFLTLICTSAGKALLIKRWGKVGAFGEMKTEHYDNHGKAVKAYATTLDEKCSGRKGYATTSSFTKDATDFTELTGAVTRVVFAKLDVADLNHLDDTIDTTGVREREAPRFTEDGEFIGDPKPRTIVVTEEMRQAEQRAYEEEQRARNPMFGMF